MAASTHFLTVDSAGRATGRGYTSDGTLVPGAVACTAAQAAAWEGSVVTGGAIVPQSGPTWAAFVGQVRAALDASDATMHRIAEGVALGTSSWTAADVVAWATYRRALRALLASTTPGTLPARPPFPAGT